jgi:DNA-directed RNA polymerase specialized sigma subunit
MSDAIATAIKKIVVHGKERGYLTYDELNAALPQDQVSSEQIEDTMTMLSELGVNVIESEESEESFEADEPAVTQARPRREMRNIILRQPRPRFDKYAVLLHLPGATPVLKSLTIREERVLKMRYGVGMPQYTLQAIGDKFGLTRERIRQIEATALRKLRHPSRSRQLRSLMGT